jgi:hypothetical protein
LYEIKHNIPAVVSCEYRQQRYNDTINVDDPKAAKKGTNCRTGHDVLDGWMLIQFIFQMDDFVFTETKNQATSHVDLRPYKGLSCSMYNVVCSVALGCNIIKLSQSKLIKRPSA